jgi:hypothetical protein
MRFQHNRTRPAGSFSWRYAAAILCLFTLTAGAGSPSVEYRFSRQDNQLLEDISRSAFRYFMDAADPRTGLVLDSRATNGEKSKRSQANAASIAATGFGLSALCIGMDRRWISREAATAQARKTLHFFADTAYNNHGWFYHFVDASTGDRWPRSEVSSIDTALLVAGMLTVRQCMASDKEIVNLATKVYERLDFPWMLDGDPLLLSQGWRPESGFLHARWNAYCELMILYVLAIGSPTHPISPESWYAWRRDSFNYNQYSYITGGPLFVYQYAHAWIDFRRRRDSRAPNTDWFQNSVIATYAQRAFCTDLAQAFPGTYGNNMWGITASESIRGYVAWGGPPRDSAIDGSIVPSAAAGSLMFTPDISIAALQNMRDLYGDTTWGKYGFADSFNPATKWVAPDVIGIDQGISLLSTENLRNSSVWKWFMKNPEITRALDLAGVAVTHTQPY